MFSSCVGNRHNTSKSIDSELIWGNNALLKNSIVNNNDSLETKFETLKSTLVQNNSSTKYSFKQKVINKLIVNKIHNLSKRNSNKESIKDINKVKNESSTQSNFSWLWAILLILAAIVSSLFVAKLAGPVAAILFFIAVMAIMYLTLPDDIASAMGEAALLILLNFLIQLLLSMI